MSDRRVGVSPDRRSVEMWLLTSLMLLSVLAPWDTTIADCPYHNHLLLGASESVIDATVDVYACQTITLEAGFMIGPTGDASLAAGGSIHFLPGVRVQAGGALRVRAGAEAPPPAVDATTISGDVCTQYGMCGLEFILAEGATADGIMFLVIWGDNVASDQMTLQQCLNSGICTSLGAGRYRIWHSYQAGNFSGELRWETPARLQGVIPFSVVVDQIQGLVLQAQAGDGSVTLDWPALPAEQYNLCRSETSVSHIDNCSVEGGRPIDLDIGMPPHLVSGLTNAQDYHFRLEGRFGSDRILSNEATATPQGGGGSTAPLNDTGITWSGHATSGSAATCDPAYPVGQDCHYGRDAQAAAGTLTKVGDGNAGFDFTKIANNGSVLPDSATLGSGPNDWACTRDNVTGLIWEVKVNNSAHLRHQDHTYTWYDPNSPDGNPGAQNGGICTGSTCDTTGFAQAVNVQGLCGASDWRMPTPRELEGIVDYGRHSPAIDTGYFPNNTFPFWVFWSVSPSAYLSGNAWNVDFAHGNDRWDNKGVNYRVRLVRGEQ